MRQYPKKSNMAFLSISIFYNNLREIFSTDEQVKNYYEEKHVPKLSKIYIQIMDCKAPLILSMFWANAKTAIIWEMADYAVL